MLFLLLWFLARRGVGDGILLIVLLVLVLSRRVGWVGLSRRGTCLLPRRTVVIMFMERGLLRRVRGIVPWGRSLRLRLVLRWIRTRMRRRYRLRCRLGSLLLRWFTFYVLRLSRCRLNRLVFAVVGLSSSLLPKLARFGWLFPGVLVLRVCRACLILLVTRGKCP